MTAKALVAGARSAAGREPERAPISCNTLESNSELDLRRRATCNYSGRADHEGVEVSWISRSIAERRQASSTEAHWPVARVLRPARKIPRFSSVPEWSLPMKPIESILADAASIAALRRDIHAHPGAVFRGAAHRATSLPRQLTDWGIPIHRGLGKTGVVGIVKGGTTRSRAVGLRADIDALPMTEHNTLRACQHAPRQDARLRPRRPHRDAARRRQAPGPTARFRRHGLPDLPARRRRRRRRARDDHRRPVRASSRWRRSSAPTIGPAWPRASSR